MSVEKDEGLQALRRGNASEAALLLETACRQNPDDFEGLLFLGAAYGRVGRKLDAITAVTRAVELQPDSAQARYNLGIAMDEAGYRDQAIQALQQAIKLQPDYTKAQQALRRMQGGVSSEEPLTAGPQSEPGYGVTPPLYGASGNLPAHTALPLASSYYLPPPTDPDQGANPYSVPQGIPYPARIPVRYDNSVDKLDALQALKDWGCILVRPNVFFETQVGRSGMLAPITLAVLYLVPPAVISPLVLGALMSHIPETPAAAVHFATGAGILVALAIGLPAAFCIWLLFSWMVHLIGFLFQSAAPYSASFRAVIYSSAPMPILLMSWLILGAAFGIGGSLIGMLLLLAGFFWCAVLLCFAVSKTQQIEVGPSVGVVLLSMVATFAVYITLYFLFTLFFIVLMVAIGAAAGK